MKASSNFSYVKALLVSKTKQTFQRRHFGVLSRKTHEAFYCWSFIVLLKEKMNVHVIYLHKPNTFEAYRNLKNLYAMKVI